MFNATSNISVIRGGKLKVEETRVHRESQRPIASQYTLSQSYGFIEYILESARIELTSLVVICHDCMGRWKSNYHVMTVSTTTQRKTIMHILVDKIKG